MCLVYTASLLIVFCSESVEMLTNNSTTTNWIYTFCQNTSAMVYNAEFNTFCSTVLSKDLLHHVYNKHATPCGTTFITAWAHLAICRRGWPVPTNFLIWIATFDSSSLSRHRKLMNDVGYPTIFSASDTAFFQPWTFLSEFDSFLDDPQKLIPLSCCSLRPWHCTGRFEHATDGEEIEPVDLTLAMLLDNISPTLDTYKALFDACILFRYSVLSEHL